MWHNHISVLRTQSALSTLLDQGTSGGERNLKQSPAFPLLKWKQAVSLCSQAGAEQELWHSNGLLQQPHSLMWRCQKKKKGKGEDLERFQNNAHCFPSAFELWPERLNMQSYNLSSFYFESDGKELRPCPICVNRGFYICELHLIFI